MDNFREVFKNFLEDESVDKYYSDIFADIFNELEETFGFITNGIELYSIGTHTAEPLVNALKASLKKYSWSGLYEIYKGIVKLVGDIDTSTKKGIGPYFWELLKVVNTFSHTFAVRFGKDAFNFPFSNTEDATMLPACQTFITSCNEGASSPVYYSIAYVYFGDDIKSRFERHKRPFLCRETNGSFFIDDPGDLNLEDFKDSIAYAFGFDTFGNVYDFWNLHVCELNNKDCTRQIPITKNTYMCMVPDGEDDIKFIPAEEALNIIKCL